MKAYNRITATHIKEDDVLDISAEQIKADYKEVLEKFAPVRNSLKETQELFQSALIEKIFKKYIILGDEYDVPGYGKCNTIKYSGIESFIRDMMWILYEDRISFCYLYMLLLNMYHGVDKDKWEDNAMPYDASLIEYASKFDVDDLKELAKDGEDGIVKAKKLLKESSGYITVCHEIKMMYETAIQGFLKYNNGHKETENSESTHSLSEFAKLYVRNNDNAARLMKYLHNRIDNIQNGGCQAIMHIQAAIDAFVLEKPTYKDVVKEFPNIGTESNYNTLIGDAGKTCIKRRKTSITEEAEYIKNMLK